MKTSDRTGRVGSPADYDPGALDDLWPAVDHVVTPDVAATVEAGAAEADRRGAMPASSLAALRKSGYFGYPVPVDLEGGGGTVVDCCALQRRLGALDPALAVAVNMHLFSVGVVVEHWRREQDASWALLEAIATQDRVVASGFAEPGLGGGILRSNLDVERADGGYVVTGVKRPCSLAAHADLVCFQMLTPEARRDTLAVCLLPTTAPGIATEPSWDAIGMRGSASDTLRFERCHVPDDLVFHRCAPGFDADEVFAAGLAWFCATTVATYLGVAAAATREAARILTASPLSYLEATRADIPTFQAALGDAVGRLVAVELACHRLAAMVDDRDRDPRAVLPLALGLKNEASQTVIAAVDGLVEVVGAQAYGSASRLGRLWRDVHALRFHPPTRYATHQILGRWRLGRPFTFEVAEAPRP